MRFVYKMMLAAMNIRGVRLCAGKDKTVFAASEGNRLPWSTPLLNTLKAGLPVKRTTASSMKKVSQLIPCAVGGTIMRRGLATFSLLFLAALILILSPCSAKAQAGFAISGQAITPGGTPASNARITVCPYTATGVPCSPQATIYSDPGLTTPLPQPYASNQYGNFNFYVTPGTSYLLQVAVNQTITYSYVYTASGTNSGGCSPNSVANGCTGVIIFTPNELVESGSTSTSPLQTTTVLPNGTTATTQTAGDSSTRVATDAFVRASSTAGCLGGNTIANGCTGASTAAAAQGNLGISPVQNIVGYGAVIDDSTPINTALANALAACPTVGSGTGGNSCSILIPGGGVGAVLGPTSTPITPNAAQAHGGTKIQGTLAINSTLVLNQGQIMGDCGGNGPEFVNKGCQATIVAPQVHGNLGTAVTSTNTTVSVSPSFVEGGMANLLVGSAITIADQVTCTGPVTLSTLQGTANYYTATCSARTDIPPLSVVSVTGCANSAFDSPSNGVSINNVDWYNNGATTSKISWYGPTGTAGSTTGCSITGVNWDTYETVEITASGGGSISFVPAYLHGSAAKWGEVAIRNPANNFQQADLENLNVQNCWGVCIWMEGATGTYLSGVAAQPEFGQITGLPIELSSAAFQQNTIDHFVALASVNFSAFCGTTNSCNPTSFPAGMLCDELPGNANGGTNANGCGGLTLTASNLQAGIWSRGNSTNTGPGHGSYFPSTDNVTVEQSNGCFITVDPRQGSISQQGNQYEDLAEVSDPSATGFGGSLTGTEGIRSYLCGTDPTGVSTGEEISLRAPQSFSTYSLSTANKYWQVPVKADSVSQSTQQYGRNVPLGIIDNGNIIQSEIDGIDAGFGPSVVPYATLPVASSGGWTFFSGSGTITPVPAPDGTMNAEELKATASGNNTVLVGDFFPSTSAGDHFIVGAWVRPGTNETLIDSSLGGPYYLETQGTDTFVGGGAGGGVVVPAGFGMMINGEWWQPVVALFTIATGDATPHEVNFFLSAPNNSGEGNQIFQPFWMYIPASANVPIDEVERWRQQLMHGYVQPSTPAGVLSYNAPLFGPATAPSGSCTQTGAWVLSQDGAITKCVAGTWTTFASGGGISGIDSNGTPVTPAAGIINLAAGTNITLTQSGNTITITAASTGATAFSALTTATNSTAAMTVGTGASMDFSGTGLIDANEVNGAVVPASAGFLASNSSKQLVAAAYTPANCTAGTTGSDCLQLSSGLVPVGNIPTAIPIANIGSAGLSGTSPITIASSGAIGCSTCLTSSGISGMTTGQVAIAGSATTITSSIALGTSGSDIPQLSGGLLAASILPKATTSAFGAVEGDASTLTLTSGVISCTTATTSQLGCVKPDGTTVTISGGVITAVGSATPNALTMNNSGSGAASGATFNGSAGVTLSYNTLGAAPALGNNVPQTTSFTIVVNTVHRFTGSGASNATTPASVTTGFIASIWNQGTAAVTVVTGGPTLVCVPSTCIVPIGAAASITTDGTNFDVQISNALGSAFGSLANLSTINNSNWSGTVLAPGNGGTGVGNTATLTLGTSNQNWATLATGIVKNTTTTGALSAAVAADVYGLWSGSCSSSTYLNGAGACGTPTGFANPMTTLGDIIYGGASGAATRLAGPVSGAGTYFVIDVPITTVAVAETFSAAATGTGAPVLAISPALTGTPDASGATQFKLPVASSFASAANGETGYDTTNKNWHLWGNGVDNFNVIVPVSTSITNGHCSQWALASGTLTLVDAGSSCGSDSGGGTSGWSGTPLTFISTATQYAPPVGGSLTSTTESVADVASPVAQTISNLSVSLSAALGAGATLQVTFRDGGVSEPLTCTTASGGASCVDSTHSFNVAKGDLIDFQLVSSGTVTAGVPQIVITYAAGTSSVGVTSIATTGPITGGTITSTGTIACPTCVTSAASLTSGALMTGAASQASQTITTGTGVTTALGVNTGSAGAVGVLIATGTAAMNTSAIASGACATVVTVAGSGIATTDVIEVGFNGDPTAVTGYGASATGAVLTIYPYPTSGNVNIKVCNSTASSITPSALTLNWKVYR